MLMRRSTSASRVAIRRAKMQQNATECNTFGAASAVLRGIGSTPFESVKPATPLLLDTTSRTSRPLGNTSAAMVDWASIYPGWENRQRPARRQ